MRRLIIAVTFGVSLPFCPSSVHGGMTLAPIGTIQANGLEFSGFSLDITTDSDDDVEIQISALLGDPLNPGIQIDFQSAAGGLNAAGGQNVAFGLSYDVATLGGVPQMKDASLRGVMSVDGPPVADVAEIIVGEDLLGLGDMQISVNSSGAVQFFDDIFFADRASLDVDTNVTLDTLTGGSATLTSLEQRYSLTGPIVPEAGSLAIWLTLGWIGLVVMRRSRHQA